MKKTTRTKIYRVVSCRSVALMTACCIGLSLGCAYGAEGSEGEKWTSLFNGKDLEGWVVKVRGQEVGEDAGKLFRVEDGLLKVSYENYPKFKGEFGHIFYKEVFKNYRLRVEYRFTGEQAPGGPGWALRNNGIMLHCQAPEGMRRNQEFPVSIEVQLLGGNGTDERSTANLCTPGTHVVMNGELFRRHCTDSTSKTFHGDQWVTVEVEVRDGVIKHLIDGEVVLEYEKPQLDTKDGDARTLIEAGQNKMLTSGYIAFQAESHPTEFRKVDICPLP